MYQYRATLLRVVDGDTIDARIDLGFGIGVDMRLRLAGIDAPERGKPGAAEATAYLQERLKPRTEIMIKSEKDRREKYGRYLADVFLPGDMISINEQMIDAGLVLAYNGGAR